MAITTDQVKALREKTGVSVMQCKKALEEAGGDTEKALLLLKKRGAAIAEKKADRSLGAGVVAAYVHANGQMGALVVLSCETDFVARNEEFQTLAHDIAIHVVASNPEYVSSSDIAPDAKERARAAYAEEVAGKPAHLTEKILQGKLDAFFAERVLLTQPFVKNPDQTVNQLIESAVQKFGERITVSRFVRFTVGI